MPDPRSDGENWQKPINTARGGRHLSIGIKRMHDVSEKFSGGVVVLDDVTQQKQAEPALLETTIRRRVIVLPGHP